MSITVSKDFDRRYARVMRRLWSHPANDQRPAVRDWLQRQLGGLPSTVIDIGGGDAYYLDIIRPRSYVIIDPNKVLLKECRARAHHLGVELRSYPSVVEAVRHLDGEAFEVKLLLHSLLYLSIDEAFTALTAISAKRCLIVHPLISASTTITFEMSIGIRAAHELVHLKERLLGKPVSTEVAKTHLCFDAATTADEELAFVVAHRAVSFGNPILIMKHAMELVGKQRGQWTVDGIVKIPQSQVMELFAFPSV